MYLRTAAVFIGLVAATTLAFAQNSKARKTPAAVSAAHKALSEDACCNRTGCGGST